MIAIMLGIEGGGKTALITKFARKHHVLKGETWAFPGYELKNNTGRVVSKLIYPEEMKKKVYEMQNVVLVIDEIQNFIHHHYWQSPVADTLANASAQRRKLNFNILASCPEFELVPPDMRRMFHVAFYCRDAHWRNKNIPVGTDIRFNVRDLRGMLSGYPGSTRSESKFDPRDYYKYYDTFSLADPKYQSRRYKQEYERVIIDPNGNVIDNNNNQVDDTIEIAREIAKLRSQNKTRLENWELHQLLGNLGFRLNTGIRQLIYSLGVRWSNQDQCYLLG